MSKLYDISLVLQVSLPQKLCLKTALYEWQAIWSKQFGKVLLINGTSSSGKTTICKYLSNNGFNIINIDEFYDNILFNFLNKLSKNICHVFSYLTDDDKKRILGGYKIKDKKYDKDQLESIQNFQDEINCILRNNILPNKMEIYDKIYIEAMKSILCGQNVAIDILVNENSLNLLNYCFHYYPIKVALLYCPLDENLKKSFNRNDISLKQDLTDFRYPAMILEQYNKLYSFISKSHVSKEHRIIEILNKNNIAEVLYKAIEQNNALFLHEKKIRYREKYHYYEGKNEDDANQHMKDIVVKTANNISLDDNEKVYVVANVIYDFIIQIPYINQISELENTNQIVESMIMGDADFIQESISL